MMKAYMFPGQGSQQRAMGGTLFDEFPEFTDKASSILGYSIKELCLQDPRKELNKTQFTQPAIYVVSALSYFKKISTGSNLPHFLLGHSLGEFNALLAAECFDFETGLKLVKKRGELMSNAVGGGMAAILNLPKNEIKRVLQEKKIYDIDLANYNSRTQVVVSGPRNSIINAADYFQSDTVDYIPLNTSGAFHSRLMLESKNEFLDYLKKFKFSKLKIPVISNVTAQPYIDTDLTTCLASQIDSAVRWDDSIRYLIARGDISFEEIGHGEILKKLFDRIYNETLSDIKNHSSNEPLNKIEENISNESDWIRELSTLSAKQKVNKWNTTYSVGTKIKLTTLDEVLETKSKAVVLFGHRAAIYLKNYNGYFNLDEVHPV